MVNILVTWWFIPLSRLYPLLQVGCVGLMTFRAVHVVQPGHCQQRVGQRGDDFVSLRAAGEAA
jgi:hypothetical protein